MEKKKIIFLSADFGAGHNTVVKSICEALDRHAPKRYEYELIDVVQVLGPTIDKFAEKAYKNAVKYSKFSWKMFFDLTNKFNSARFDKYAYPLIVNYLDKIFAQKPDLVISVYPMLTYAISRYFDERGEKVPLVTVVTDTGEVHNMWAVKDVDYYIVPTYDTGFYLAERGIDREKIVSLGFPLRQQFYRKYNRVKALKDLGLPINQKTIMFFTGAWGVGKIKKKIELLDNSLEDISIIAVCGNNKNLEKTLLKTKFKNKVKVLGFINHVAEVMSASDLVIAKAGGNSFMEVITLKKPMVISEVVPGQEEPNARFTEMMGFGYVEEDPEEMVKRIKYILTTKDYDRLVRNLRAYTLNDETDKKIVRFINEKCNEKVRQ